VGLTVQHFRFVIGVVVKCSKMRGAVLLRVTVRYSSPINWDVSLSRKPNSVLYITAKIALRRFVKHML